MSGKRTLFERCGGFRKSEPVPRGREHFLEPRMLPDRIKVGVSLEMPDPSYAVHLLEKRTESIERLIGISELTDHRTCKIVAHVQVIWIEKHRPSRPFAGPLCLAEHCKRIRPC